MAMTRGTVTIDPDTGAVSGGGYARALFDAMWATITPSLGSTPASGVIQAKQRVADQCNAQSVIIDYIKANASVPSGITVSVNTTTHNGSTTGAGTVS